MEKTQSEVTDKIRYAIKEKLKEMNTFVDDELPDYIMILIANKRSKHHMEKDLSLFLGNQTIDFTNWLWDLVNAFKAGTKSKSSKTWSSLEAQRFDISESKADEDDVLNYDPAEEGESLCLEETNELTVDSVKVVETYTPNPQTSLMFEMPVDFPKDSLLPTTADIPQLKTSIKQEKIEHDIAITEPAKSKPNEKTIQKSAKVYPMRRLSHSNMPEKHSVTKPSNSVRSEFGGVSSVVTISQRKYGRPAALQANKLLLKAVSDATKSVLKGKDINECYKPTPIKELISSEKSVEMVHDKAATQNNPVIDFVVNPVVLLNQNIGEQNINSCNDSNEIVSRRVVNLSQTNSGIDNKFEESNISLSVDESPLQTEEENTVTPHFIVTLDGVNFSTLKRKHSISEEPMDIDDDNYSDETMDQSREKRPKLAERCKYWPACKNSVNCAYHHPTVSCKSFPNCKFGDKCLYIHPNCKFDALCSKRDCPFTHCSVRKYPSLPAAVIHPVKNLKGKTVCKYYPRCTAKPCPFIHPKLCKFGTQCRAPKCLFGHFQIPQRDQLKWTSK